MIRYLIVGLTFGIIGYRIYSHVNNKINEINEQFDDL